MTTRAAIAVAAIMIAAPGASAQVTASPEETRIDVQKAERPSTRSAGWSKERMGKARPAPLLVIGPRQAPEEPAAEQPNGRGATKGATESKQAARYSSTPYGRPLWWAGKVFFKEDGEDKQCSGQFIDTKVVLTAAHCLRSQKTGKYNVDVTFAWQYHRGQYKKQLRGECLATFNGWVQKGDSEEAEDRTWKWDYALIRVGEDYGNFGWHLDWRGEYGSANSIGYPGGLEEGEVIQVEGGSLFFPKSPEGVVGLRTKNRRERGGASGGAMVANFNTNNVQGANHVISVNSYTMGGDESVQYGPYLTSDLPKLIEAVRRGCR